MYALIWTAGLAWAQEKKADEPVRFTQKIIEVHHVNVNALAELVRIPGVSVKADGNMRVLVVAGPPDAVSAIEEMAKKLDVAPPPPPPHPNIEITAYLVSGTTQDRIGDAVPQELGSTAKQLHAVFPYKSYRLLESFVLRGRDGLQGSTSGVLPGTNSSYDFRYNAATVSDGTPRVVHIDRLQLRVNTPTGARDKDGRLDYRNVGLDTNIDAGEGQKIVVGKSNINGSDEALILIVTAKVVE